MHHSKYDYVKQIVEANLNPLLVGTSGTGKTTLFRQIAEDLGLDFYSIPLTKQTSVGNLLGFISVNGTYIPSQFRTAYEHGGMFLLDELSSGDSNTLLVLNSLEAGFMSFPDKIIYTHPDFRLVATDNPHSEHNIYTGRNLPDFSTTDRFYEIPLERDSQLELSLTSQETVEQVDYLRDFLVQYGSTMKVTMRDATRIHKLSQLNLDDDPLISVVLHKDPALLETYHNDQAERKRKQQEAEEARRAEEARNNRSQSEAENLDDLFDLIKQGK